MAISPNVVLDLLRGGPLEVTAIATRLGDQVAYNDVLDAITSLARDGLIEPSPPGHKYRVTDAGRRNLSA